MNRRSFLCLALATGPLHRVLAQGVKAAHLPMFADVTAKSGIRFKHEASRTAEKYLPETMGAGVAMFDYNNDGRLDLFFVNGARLRDPMPRGAFPDKSDPRFGTDCIGTTATALLPMLRKPQGCKALLTAWE